MQYDDVHKIVPNPKVQKLASIQDYQYGLHPILSTQMLNGVHIPSLKFLGNAIDEDH